MEESSTENKTSNKSKEQSMALDTSSSKANADEKASVSDNSKGKANRNYAPFRQPRIRIVDVVSALEEGDDEKEHIEAMNELLKLVEGTSEKAATNRAFVTQHPEVFNKVQIILVCVCVCQRRLVRVYVADIHVA